MVSMKTKGLFAEYEALADIVAKNILGQVGSHDTMSANKFTVIDWIVKGKKVNWMKLIWPALVHQVENFQVKSTSKGKWELVHGVSFGLQIMKLLVDLGCVTEDDGVALDAKKIVGGALPSDVAEFTGKVSVPEPQGNP